MSEKEHPARTAGKYVRAAGIAIKKERERLAAEGEAKRAAEAARAQQQAAVQPPVKAVAPPPPPPPAQPAAAAPAPPRRRQASLAPPPSPFLDRLVWTGFVIMAVATCLALLNIQMLASGTAQDVVKLALGGILLVAAVVLLLNLGHAKERLLANVTKRLWGLEHPTTRTGRFMRSMAKDILTLLGITWLAIAVYEILSVLVN